MRLLAVVVGVVLLGCGASESTPEPYQGHRLVGVWNGEGLGGAEGDSHLPTTDQEWKEFLAEPEASFVQFVFRADGTALLGGLMLGHQVADESTWQIIEEQGNRISLRMTDEQGRVDDSMTVTFEDEDTMYMPHPGEGTERMYLRRTARVAPVPWLQD